MGLGFVIAIAIVAAVALAVLLIYNRMIYARRNAVDGWARSRPR